MPKKIAITGPESSGKTTLSNLLSTFYDAPTVEEYARTFLDGKAGIYNEKDLIEIARGQINLEKNAMLQEGDFIFCDTDLLVIKVWGIYKYGRCDQRIVEWWNQSQYDLHLLLKPDIPYEHDTIRENPTIEDRKELFNLYENELKSKHANYAIIQGSGEARFEAAKFAIKEHFFI